MINPVRSRTEYAGAVLSLRGFCQIACACFILVFAAQPPCVAQEEEEVAVAQILAGSDAEKYQLADATYLKVLELNPQLATARLNRADVLRAMKRFSEAEEEANRVLSTQKPPLSRETRGSAYDSLGRIAYAQNDFRRATEFFRKAVESYPLANSFYLLAYAEAQIGEYRAAAEHISRYIRHMPEAQKNIEMTRAILARILPNLTRQEWDDVGLTSYGIQLRLKPKSTWSNALRLDNPLVKVLALVLCGALIIILHRMLIRRNRTASGRSAD